MKKGQTESTKDDQYLKLTFISELLTDQMPLVHVELALKRENKLHRFTTTIKKIVLTKLKSNDFYISSPGSALKQYRPKGQGLSAKSAKLYKDSCECVAMS